MHGYMGAECRDLCAVWMCTRGRAGPGCRCHVALPQLYCMMHMRSWPIFSGVHVFKTVIGNVGMPCSAASKQLMVPWQVPSRRTQKLQSSNDAPDGAGPGSCSDEAQKTKVGAKSIKRR